MLGLSLVLLISFRRRTTVRWIFGPFTNLFTNQTINKIAVLSCHLQRTQQKLGFLSYHRRKARRDETRRSRLQFLSLHFVLRGMALAKEFGVSEKRTERDSLYITINIPRFENLMTALHYNGINYIIVQLVQLKDCRMVRW